MENYMIATANGKYVSEIYYMTGQDFETSYEADAKKFSTEKEAKEYIADLNLDPKFAWTEKV